MPSSLRWSISLLALLTGAVSAWGQSPSQKLPSRAVCTTDGKAIAVGSATLTVYVNSQPRFFCSSACRDRFAGFPEKYVKETVYCTVQPSTRAFVQTGRRTEVNNNLYYLCCEPCVGWMRDKPWLYFKELRDPVTGHWFKPEEGTPRSTYERQAYLFENAESKAEFDKEPKKYAVVFRR